MYNRVKKDAFDVALDSALEGTSKRTSKGARKGTIRSLHKDPREDAFECVNKGALSKKCTWGFTCWCTCQCNRVHKMIQ